MTDQITSATSDIVVDESHDTGHLRLQTNYDRYTGSVGGEVKKILGANRPFDAVLDDYKRYFTSKSDWKWEVNDTGTFLARNNSDTAKVYIQILDLTEGYTAARNKYQIVYKVWLIYGEPGLWEG